MSKFVSKLLSFIFICCLILSFNVHASQNDVTIIHIPEEKILQRHLIATEYVEVNLPRNLLSDKYNLSNRFTLFRSGLSDKITCIFNFYNLGNIDGKHTYEVHMNATAIDDVLFTYTKLSIKPKNNLKYLVSETHPPYVSFANDVIQYQYNGDGPKNPTVTVKASLGTDKGTYKIPNHKLSNPIQ